MEPKMEQPKQYTPEEIAHLEKSRTISDAELLKGGAEYAVDEKGEKKLVGVSSGQMKSIQSEKFWFDGFLDEIKKEGIQSGERVTVNLRETNGYFNAHYVGIDEEKHLLIVSHGIGGQVFKLPLSSLVSIHHVSDKTERLPAVDEAYYKISKDSKKGWGIE